VSDFDAEIRVSPEALQRFAGNVLRRLGVPQPDAALIARCLVQVDLRGIRSHGVRYLGEYAEQYRAGQLNPTARPRVIQDDATAIVMDGDSGLGYMVASQATEKLIARTGATGLCMAATRRHGHVGSLGIYARMALDKDLATLSFAAASVWPPPMRPDSTVWDATTSPATCIAIPSAGGSPLVADMSANSFRDRETLPAAMDAFPEAVIKSMALQFAATLLGGTLAGQVESGPVETARADQRFSAARRGFLMLAFHPGLIADADTFLADVQRIIAGSRSMPPLPGLERSDVAGSLEWEREREWLRLGIPFSREERRGLERLASELGVEIPWHE
jgi:LDH2 family malate/lactate/ureidoglycolate dehydrogenase